MQMFRLFPAAVVFFLFCCASTHGAPSGGASDIYPAQPGAQAAVQWKDGYFYLNGKPTFLTAGEIHYARVPRELWRDRLWRAKQMGFNCIQTYVFWNASEPSEGQWDFSDNNDLDAWLSLLEELNLYAIVRVGPYVCAEWEQGGLPAWLTAKPGMSLRDPGSFMTYADRHLARVEQIVAKHQLHLGGRVIMIQVENEHPRGWGMDDKDPYLKHLVDQARQNGIEIPFFLSGLHHGSDPSGEAPYKPARSPWYSTEFWTGWIGRYGDMSPGMLNEKIRGTWKIIAFGGAGYDYYMVHGGSNFGYSGHTTMASYDYSAPIGETGQFHNFYFPARRAAWFAQSFSELLTSSHDDPTFARSDVASLRVTTRTSPTGGSIVFIDNFKKGQDKSKAPPLPPDASAYRAPSSEETGAVNARLTVGSLTLPHEGSLNVISTEPSTVMMGLPWTANTSFESICTNVLFRKTLGTTDYWVCYGTPGQAGEITLRRKRPASTPAQVRFTYPEGDAIQEIDLDSGDGPHARVLVINTAMTRKTWLANEKIALGPSFVLEDGKMEFPPAGGYAVVYSARGKSEMEQPSAAAAPLPVFAPWTWRDAATERASDFPTADWAQSKGPQPMESYGGFQNRYGWYRTTLHCDAAGTMALHCCRAAADFTVFLNGKLASMENLPVKAGDNTLAVLAKAWPRPTLYNVTGPIHRKTARGLWGISTATLRKLPITWERWTGAGNPMDSSASPDAGAWQPVTQAGDSSAPSQSGNGQPPVWYRGRFVLSSAEAKGNLNSTQYELIRKTTVTLNGQPLAAPELDGPKTFVAGTNTLLIETREKNFDPGKQNFFIWNDSSVSKSPWQFRGGLDNLQETAIIGRALNWNDFLAHGPWQNGAPKEGSLPTFWKTTFDYPRAAKMTETLVLMTDGLKSGHVWLNGHNLGECPQKEPLYLPECWLKVSGNELVIFDIKGAKPDQIKLQRLESFTVVPVP